MFKRSSLIVLLLILSSSTFALAEEVKSDLRWSLTVDAPNGDYQITTKALDWTIGGSVGQAITDIKSADGQDRLGDYREIVFRWRDAGQMSGGIRLYKSRPCVLFTVIYEDAAEHASARFPVLSQLPPKLMPFRYGEKDHLRPALFELKPQSDDEQYGGPVALFDEQTNTMILSPASDFMVAMMSGDQEHGLRSGLNRTLHSIPAGYTYQTLLTVGHGINHTWDVWGDALTTFYGTRRPANDADAGLKYLGYWTDNGAHYYYNYDLERGYQGTLLALKKHLDEAGIPIRYMQLDSWWYHKTFNSLEAKSSNKPRAKDPRLPAGTWNRYGGLLEYTAHPDLFPQGLSSFHTKLGLPLITHNRWVDPESPYHSSYKISGVAAVDPKWWDKIIGDIADWGVTTYEQDWLNYLYNRSPELSNTTGAGEAFMDGMANACAKRGLTMQYCMVLPRHVMQGAAKYPNFTTVRVSGDRFEKGKWSEFLYGSRMAAALGVWPWADVFRSRETPNMLLATLSAGMVGLSDRLGDENIENIFRAVRRDGVIVKPDVPITPIDATFIHEAQKQSDVFVAATHTTHPSAGVAGTAMYVFAFKPKTPGEAWSLEPSSIGLGVPTFAYDFFTGDGQLIEPGKSFSSKLRGDWFSYIIFAPVGKSGMALIGDTGMFVTRGKKRITMIRDDADQLHTSVLLANHENEITLGVYAPSKPVVAAVARGSCKSLAYDETTKIARAVIAVDPAIKPTMIDGDPVVQIDVTFRLR